MISLTTLTATSALSFAGREQTAAHAPHSVPRSRTPFRPSRGWRAATLLCAAVISGSLLSAVVLGMTATGAADETPAVTGPAPTVADATTHG